MTGIAERHATLTPDRERELFDVPQDVAYLNCANMSPQLRRVTEAGVAAVSAKASPWTLRAADWFASTERLRTLFARLINGDPDGVAIVPAVSYGIALAAANVPVAAGQSIVVLDGEFPSNVYAWQKLTVDRFDDRGCCGSKLPLDRRAPSSTSYALALWRDPLAPPW